MDSDFVAQADNDFVTCCLTDRPGLDRGAHTHEDASMRTTIDLPDELYRTLKARAALSGVTLRDLVRSLVEQGLRQPVHAASTASHWGPPPVIVPPRGTPIGALSADDLHRLEEEDDVARARSVE